EGLRSARPRARRARTRGPPRRTRRAPRARCPSAGTRRRSADRSRPRRETRRAPRRDGPARPLPARAGSASPRLPALREPARALVPFCPPCSIPASILPVRVQNRNFVRATVSQDPHRAPGWEWPAAALAAALAGLAVWLAGTRWGAAVSPDSTIYLSAAE